MDTTMFMSFYCYMFHLLSKVIIRQCKNTQRKSIYIQPIRMALLQITEIETLKKLVS